MVRGARYVLTFTREPAVVASDDEGHALVGVPTTTTARGTLDILRGTERARAQAFAAGVTAAAHVDHGTTVDARDTCRLDPNGWPPIQAEILGDWEVAYVQHLRPHLRVLLRRVEQTAGDE